MTWESPCKVAITTIQDLLELGAEGRFNLPGTQKGNWKWRIEDLDQLLEPLEKLKLLNLIQLKSLSHTVRYLSLIHI